MYRLLTLLGHPHKRPCELRESEFIIALYGDSNDLQQVRHCLARDSKLC